MTALTLISDASNSVEFQLANRQLVTLLEKSATLAYQAVDAIVKQDAVAARALTDQLRQHNVQVVAARDRINKDFPYCEPSATDAQVMAYALEIFRSAEQVVHEWISGNGEAIGRGEEVAKEEYWHRNVDLLLPALWDFETDVFVVKGDYDPTLMSVLEERKQRRVLFVGTNCSESQAEVPSSACSVVRSHEQLLAYVALLETPLPFRFAYLSLSRETDEWSDTQGFNTMLEKAVMSRWMDSNTRNTYSRRWVDQGLKNLSLFADGRNLKELDGVFKGKPAILIAPGPSLEKNVRFLKDAKGRAVLIAQLQSVRRLYKEGIQPDFVVVLDPQDLTAPPFNNLQGIPDEFLTNLVVGVTCHPEVIRRFKSVYYFGGGGGVDRWLQSQLPFSLLDLSGSTTAISCLRLALAWKCSPVIMVGQDLSVSDGRRYAGGEADLMTTAGMHELPGFYGGTVKSPSNYYLFHFALEELARNARRDDPAVELLNCTEGGAFVDGFAHLKLQDVIEERIALIPKVEAWSLFGQEREKDLMRAERHTLRDKVQNMIGALDLTVQELVVCDELLQQARRHPEILPKLNSEEAKMKALLKKISIFSIIFEKEISEVIKISKSARSLSDGLNVSETLYRLISQGCEELRPSLISARQVLDEAV